MDGLDRDHQRRESVPENWGLERERKSWVPRLRQLQAALRETVFPLLQRFVLFYIILYHFWLDSLRFACGWEAHQEAERQRKEKLFLFIWLEAENWSEEEVLIWLEAEDWSEEEGEFSGFRGNKSKYQYI